MEIDFDPQKHAANLSNSSRRLGFDRAHDFDWRLPWMAEVLQSVGNRCDRLPASLKMYVTLTRSVVLWQWVIWMGACMYCVLRPLLVAFGLSVSARLIKERQENMVKPLPLTDEGGEVRELTAEDFKHFRPAAEVLPELFGAELAAEMLSQKKPGRPRIDAPKIFTGIRLDAEVLEAFRATGRGWQTRINDALKEWLKEHAAG